MQVGFPGPHPPFILTEAMNASVAGRTYPAPQGSSNTLGGDEFYQTMRRQYAAEIENLDSLIGKLMQTLDATDALSNTVVAISADHGEMLGDYNKFSKNVPWDGSSRVPLLFMGPNIQAGSVVTQPVTTLDIVGTFLDLAEAELAENMTTRSMKSLLMNADRSSSRSFILSGLGSESCLDENDHDPPGVDRPIDWRMVVKQMNATSTLKLVCCPAGCNGINGNSTLFPKSSSSQLGLFEISDGREEVDFLSRGVGRADAVELVKHLPPKYLEACGDLLESKLLDLLHARPLLHMWEA
jgi:hypothetical protein